MNLKESFRYQSFIDKLMTEARYSLMSREHAFKITKKHLKSKANSDAEDMIETVELDEFHLNDDVILFTQWLITEKQKLTEAICKAKNSLDFCYDAAIEANKYRQSTSSNINMMLKNKAKKTVETGRGYKFNVEGNQTVYAYDIEVEYEENFDRKSAKAIARELTETADEVSAKLDAATINTQVDYDPVFNVNDSFTEVMDEFIEKIKPLMLTSSDVPNS